MNVSARNPAASVLRAGSGGHASFASNWLSMLKSALPFVFGVRNDQGVMIHRRHVQLHAVELQHIRHHASAIPSAPRRRATRLNFEWFGPPWSVVTIQLRPILAAPSARSCGVCRSASSPLIGSVEFGPIVARTPMTVDVGVTGEPPTVRRLGHRGNRGGHEQQKQQTSSRTEHAILQNRRLTIGRFFCKFRPPAVRPPGLLL